MENIDEGIENSQTHTDRKIESDLDLEDLKICLLLHNKEINEYHNRLPKVGNVQQEKGTRSPSAQLQYPFPTHLGVSYEQMAFWLDPSFVLLTLQLQPQTRAQCERYDPGREHLSQ